ncbi:phenylalanyl-tRNA synthetase subunit beta [Spiroplasma litorale]|uniref:Phenylalanine--tRNA ligase beta subunit n=1 Tax=Spiroplasma litorale TaxID=216942 RepID=A0A0K1W0Q4_9MOLU|nr:phenylalanine--tRNA ligase subunit beta [Spiroplasma litorale]AKX33899.1 phenylalanyl-tRNA synthetase subunit beta [Spiroplasma litorale]
MYITRNWLSKFIDLTGVKDVEITNALNSLGFEVESYKNYSKLNDKLKIVHVGSVTPIENTKLNFCFIDSGEDLVTPVVCGAKNIAEGDYVIWAEPGKTISTGQKLAKKEIMGKISEGMICSLTEIGLNESSQIDEELEGIYKIYTKEETYKLIGFENALEKIGFLDSVWEVDLTLNRSDALAAFQLLKEIANYFDKEIVDYSKNFEFKIDEKVNDVTLKVDNNTDKIIDSLSYLVIDLKEVVSFNGKYSNQLFSNDDIWLKFNSVKKSNNFFENIQNMVSIETGLPPILIDADKAKNITIKKTVLDDKECLQILSENNEVGIVGIKINEDFLVTNNTKKVLAIFGSFNNVFMRNQQKKFNANNTSIQRFTKPLSKNLIGPASKRLLYLLYNYNIFSKTSGIVSVVTPELNSKKIKVSLNYINTLLGTNLTFVEIINLFKTLDFEVTHEEDMLIFKIDSNRTDIENQSDICEEIARLYGYDNIKSVPPKIIANPIKKELNLNIKNKVDSYLYGKGFNNIKTYSLISEKNLKNWNLFNILNPIKVMSPLSKFKEFYRTNLSNSIIEIASLNATKGSKELSLYEFADIYNSDGLRMKHLGILISGNIIKDKANNLEIKSTFFYIKGIFESIISIYNISTKELSYVELKKPNNEIHPFISFKVLYKNDILGVIFKLNPRYEQSLKLSTTYVCELDISALEKNKNSNIIIKPISKYQSSTRDITFILKKDSFYSDIISKVTKEIKNLVDCSLIDLYVDDELNKNNCISVTISLKFNSDEKQLTDAEINDSFEKILLNFNKINIEVK